jgi:hypothetical protein
MAMANQMLASEADAGPAAAMPVPRIDSSGHNGLAAGLIVGGSPGHGVARRSCKAETVVGDDGIEPSKCRTASLALPLGLPRATKLVCFELVTGAVVISPSAPVLFAKLHAASPVVAPRQ